VFDTAWREALRAQRRTFTHLMRDGVITDDTFAQLVGEVDLALEEPYTLKTSFARSTFQSPVSSLMTVIIQENDAENAVNMLNKMGIVITRLPSIGGLLKKKNVTLLIGVPKNLEENVWQTLDAICKTRVVHKGDTSQIEIGCATIFSFDIECYKEL